MDPSASLLGERSAGSRTIAEVRFRSLVEVTNTIVWVLNPDGVVDEEQPSLQAFTGIPWPAIKGEGWVEAVHPDDRARVVREWKELQPRRGPAEILYRMRRHDGVYRLMRARAIPIFESDGSLREWVGANDDITEAQAAREAQIAREARLLQFANALPHMAWETNAAGGNVWCNERFYAFTGVSPGDPQGWGWVQVLHPDDHVAYVAGWRTALAARQRYVAEARVRRHDGEYRWVRFDTVPMLDDSGAITHWLGTGTDIHEEHSAILQLHASEEALREADQRKDRFLATLAHELRNPLAPIRSGLQILEAAGASADARDAATRMMGRQVDHMVRLIDDLLDLSRVSSDKLTLHFAPLSMQGVLRSAIETVRPILDAGSHTLQERYPSEPLFVNADLTRLSQVFANLLHNAVKYSALGRPIRVRLERDGDFALATVEDEGVGIAPDMHQHVFEMFAQVDPSSAKGGLGIGLSIAHRLVSLHGGTIGLSSTPGKGSCFHVRVPLHAATMHPIVAAPPILMPVSASKRVLIADDNRDAAESLAMLAGLFGHDARAVHDGASALREGERFVPDVVILDIGMPDMNGYEVARSLRQTDWGANVKLVALTGWGQDRDRRLSIEAGFDQHLVKPIGGEVLQRLLG